MIFDVTAALQHVKVETFCSKKYSPTRARKITKTSNIQISTKGFQQKKVQAPNWRLEIEEISRLRKRGQSEF